MVHIEHLIDPGLLSDMLEQGYIRERRHPTYPYRILNYTETAAYEGLWNEATRQCRGLVIDDQGHVIARPFEKFHNHTEHDGQKFPTLDLSAPVTVTDKADGSLGILVPKPDGDGYIVATRGSFESEQAQWATAFYDEHYADTWFMPTPGFTYLFEIVYPENRIVVNYGWSDLVLLGTVEITTGEMLPVTHITDWPGRKVHQFEYSTLQEALAAPVRDNAEGLVIRYRDSGLMVKIKQDDYIRLHRIVTGLSERMVWEHAASGRLFPELLVGLPDEFHQWVTQVWDRLREQYDQLEAHAELAYDNIRHRLRLIPDKSSRKAFAAEITVLSDGLDSLVFPILQRDTEIWKQIKPAGDTRMWNQDNETEGGIAA